jgi:alpha-amylase
VADFLVVYTIVHQPHRLRLPARPIPPGAEPADVARCLFDPGLDRHYFLRAAERCYRPACELFRAMVADGFRLAVGFSGSFLEQARSWDPQLLAGFRGLVRTPGVELVAVEPDHSFVFYLDVRRFVRGMRRFRAQLEAEFGVPVRATDTTEMFLSNDLYFAVAAAGFEAAMLDGRAWVLGGREPTHLYRHAGLDVPLFVRHTELSDDVGFRFSDRTWSAYPLMAPEYARWIRQAPGDLVFLGWDFETFGEHHGKETGIFEFMAALPRELRRAGVRCLTPAEALGLLGGRARDLQLPEFASTWAGDGGASFFLGNPVQQALFQLMHHAYHKAVLTGDARYVELAARLTQSDILHLTQWYGRSDAQAAVSAHFTPREWWDLGPDGIVWEVQQVFKNFIRALDPPAARAVARCRGRRGPG